MNSRFGPKLTYANVTATVALFIALGGGAYAATHLPNNSVTSKTIRNGQVKGKDVDERSLGTVGSARKADQTHGLRSYRVSAVTNEGQNGVTVWRHGSFRLKLDCEDTGANTLATPRIGSPKAGVDLSAVRGREGGGDPNVFANDNADPGDYGAVGQAVGLNGFYSVGNTSFAAALPGADGRPKQTVTGNLVILARHHASGKDCSVSGQVSTG